MKKRKNTELERRERGAIGEEDVEDEEKKINMFYSIIRNLRDAQNQMLVTGLSNPKEKAKGKENVKQREMKSSSDSSWTPSFTWEDFAADHARLKGNTSDNNDIVMVPTSSKDQEQPKTEKPDDLDLNLSL
ncbi:conserved hypothetical protein [Ricinus communis]|uniref:Uncharacterized protein n=2 Tax=Ricinus communis TaxID=3988 RepID=B9RN84_RICCO|nr:conserved hypothetical protein [Ricinus communis]